MNWLENSKSLTTPWKQRVGSKRPRRFGDVSQWNNQPRRLAQTQSSFANTYLYFVLSNSLLYIYSPLYFKVFFHFLHILSLSLSVSHIDTHIHWFWHRFCAWFSFLVLCESTGSFYHSLSSGKMNHSFSLFG